jgi:hypothetical protein
MCYKTLRLLLCLGLLPAVFNGSISISASAQSVASDKIFPTDAHIVNVKTAYGAKGDGTTDDTQAILNAIKENIGYRNGTGKKVIYFPKGTYLVSNTLEWKNDLGKWNNFLTFQGQNRDASIIKLKNNALDYNNPNIPKAVIYTAGTVGLDGSGGDALRNNIFDLTIDTGTGNSGAVGIDYHTNNLGAIRNVTIRSGETTGTGKVGLKMTRAWPGPCLIKNVKISGFDVGIDVVGPEFSVTLEHIDLEKQKIAGIRNRWNVLSIRKLTSSNSVPAIIQEGGTNLKDKRSFTVLVDAKLNGGSLQNVAIDNSVAKGNIFLRNVTTSGYKAALNDRGKITASISGEYVSLPAIKLFDSSNPRSGKSLNLLIEETPTFHDNNLTNWVDVTKFGATPDDMPNDSSTDDTSPIQNAINSSCSSGKSTLYFPTGDYRVSSTITLKCNIKKVVGLSSRLLNDSNNPQPVLRVGNGTSDIVIIDGLSIVSGRGNNPGSIGIEQATSRPLVIQDSQLAIPISYQGISGAGKLFLEDVVGPKYKFVRNQQVWARQLDAESNGLKILNDGGKLWILGLKTENRGPQPGDTPTVIETGYGGSTELLGGLIYPTGQTPSSAPAFIINQQSNVSLSYAVSAYATEANYPIQVRETRNQNTKNLTTSALLGITYPGTQEKVYGRGEFGSVMPLYSGVSP